MSTLNNKTIYGITPYIQNQLAYNLPLQVYSENGTILTNDIKVQAFKRNNLGLKILIGIELIQNTNFVVSINNTANGIIITLLQNIVDAEFLEVYRYTNPQSTSEYQSQIQTTTLKQSLDNDITNAFNSLQEHEKLLQNVRTETSKYSEVIINQNTTISDIQADLATIPRNALQLPAFPSLGLNSTNTQGQINELKLAVDEARKGITLREAVKVASIENVNINNVNTIDGINLLINDRVLLRTQSIKGQNGIYYYNGVGLTRTADANTLSKIAGSQAQITNGTYINNEFYCIVDNINGVLGVENIIVERIFNAVGSDQIQLFNLSKQPAGTVIANITNSFDNPSYINKTQLKTFLEIENINNTSDLNKPISNATQNAINLKANQSDLQDLNSYVVQTDNQLLTAIGNKQDALVIGGNNQYVGFNNNIITNNTFSKSTVNLQNVDNTRDIDKPISNLQQAEFNKTFKHYGNLSTYLTTADLNLAINLLSGTYFVDSAFLNLPTLGTSFNKAIFQIFNVNNGIQKVNIIQYFIHIETNTGINNKLYSRIYNVFNNTFSEWKKNATEDDITILSNRIDGIVNATFEGSVYTIPQVDTLLNNASNLVALTYAPINNANLTGTPTAPTPATTDNSTKIATTEFVKSNKGKLNNQFVFIADFTITPAMAGAQIYINEGTCQTITFPEPSTGFATGDLIFIQNRDINSTGISLKRSTGEDIIINDFGNKLPCWWAVAISTNGGTYWDVIIPPNDLQGRFILPASPSTTDNSTKIATTQYVKQNLVNYAPISNPNFVGGNLNLTNNLNNGLVSIINFTNPSTPNDTQALFRFTPNPNNPDVYQDILQAVFTNNVLQGITLPNANLTGTPTAPTPATTDNSTKIATTQYVKQNLVNTALTGTPTAPTPATTDNSTKIATTEFVKKNYSCDTYSYGGLKGILTTTSQYTELSVRTSVSTDIVNGSISFPLRGGTFTRTPQFGMVTLMWGMGPINVWVAYNYYESSVDRIVLQVNESSGELQIVGFAITVREEFFLS